MIRNLLLWYLFLFLSTGILTAQKDPEEILKKPQTGKTSSNLAQPKNSIEIGLNGGITFVGGEVGAKYAYGGGLHLRKAMDYMLSIRFDGLYAQLKGENSPVNIPRDFQTTWYSGTFYGVMSLNSMRFDRPVRKGNPFIMAGFGANNFKVSYNSEDVRKGELPNKWSPHLALGAGWNFRLSKKFNFGIEEQVFMAIGGRGDELDGFNNQVSQFPDILSFTNLSLNFNLGNPRSKTEPLYWINPMDGVLNEIENLKSRSSDAIKDQDGDGVIDALDQEPDTPSTAMVDTKGRTLDSDHDGIPDHLDREPFYVPGPGEKVNEDGIAVSALNGSPSNGGRMGIGVTENRVKELIDQALKNYSIADSRTSAAEWFLPMLHFANGSAIIKYSDYGNLSSLARTLKANPTLRLVITGYTDSTGPEAVNNAMSYERAKNVIDHLVNTHGIGRTRLVLQWKGSADNLVPSSSSFMNRRVEFRLAGSGDVEMDPPAKKDDGGY